MAHVAEKKILLSMNSPFISTSWLTNPVTGISYSGCFKNYPNQGKQAIDNLVKSGLLKVGFFLINGKKESYVKVSPLSIRGDPNLLAQLNSYGISIDQYEDGYRTSSLPFKVLLNQNGIETLLTDVNFIPFYHLFIHQSDFHKKVQERINEGMLIEQFDINNKKNLYSF